MRYRINLAYNGAIFAGWQRQPNASTIQERLEAVLSRLWHERITITGCGRTDAGVHASDYWAHFDALGPCPDALLKKANANLPPEIRLYSIESTHDQWHARFDACSRTYQYLIVPQRDPLQPFRFVYYKFADVDFHLLQQAASTMAKFDAFKPFCKTRSDVKHHLCQIHAMGWMRAPDLLVFTVEANRFLRGMVRLMVGACLHVAIGRMTIEMLEKALREQKPLQVAWSVPAQGLILSAVKYHPDQLPVES